MANDQNTRFKEYLEIPLNATTEGIVSSLSNVQTGKLFQAVMAYAFYNVKPNFEGDNVLAKAFPTFIKQCSKKGERYLLDGCGAGYTEAYENYEDN